MSFELFDPLYNQLVAMWVGFLQILPMLAIGLVVVFFTWLIAKVVSRVIQSSLNHSHIRPSLKGLFGTLAKVGVWTIGILITITVIFPSMTPAKMLATVGLGSVAIGFAFKDIFENFLAGILIMLREPMRIGDFIECESVEGWVEKIGIRETYLRKPDQQLILVPNAFLFKNPVYVRTDHDIRRFEITAGVGYGENVDACREIIHKAVQSVQGLAKDKPVQVFAKEFNSSSIDYTVRWWAGSKPLDMHESRDKVIAAIKAALDEAGVEIPFPYRTLTFSEPLKIEGLGELKSDQETNKTEAK